jgi:alkylated DNA repair dioxygenase AlkB
MPTRSVAPLTQPEEFQFATDSRAAIRKPIQDPETTPPEAKVLRFFLSSWRCCSKQLPQTEAQECYNTS